ncbi:MAG TPA: adenylate cyclase regulatory domain-containing protein [Acidimicrobiales bacterium]|nr:adenylate cyclase regulatory domain-containing protein [Acidimicrobiales bacterium]
MDDPRTAGVTLTLAELAGATGIPLDTLRAWRELGLLSDRGDALSPQDVERARLLHYVERRGIAAETVARASETQGDLLGNFVDNALVGRRPGAAVSLADAPAATGLDPAVFQRLWVAAGLGDQHEADQDDLDAMRGLRIALDAGLPEDALVQIVRVFADALGRAADAELRLFHHYVHERLRAEGLTGRELLAADRAVSEPLMGLIEPMVLYFHRNAFRRAQREDLLLHLDEEGAPPAEVPGEVEATILFVDLSAFTALTEAMGDAAAAGLMERFSDLVRGAARRCHGRVVKQIGDEFMLAFGDPAAAVRCALEIEAAGAAEPQFPAIRMGAHAGAVLYREGDYVGATVNVAARVVAEARRHEFLITATVRAGTDARDLEVTPVGARDLRGIAGSVELFGVRRLGGRGPERMTDPVCLMELDPGRAAAQLTWHGTDLRFCSDDCLRIFIATPDRYLSPP